MKLNKINISLSGTDVLYHITTIGKAAGIVSSNRLELKPSDGTAAEEALGKSSYYLSTTRSKTGSYTRKQIWSYSVIFALDGRLLNQRYKVVPVDYWNTNDSLHNERLARRDYYESEDRVISRSPTIPKAFDYITSIHVHVNDKVLLLRALKKAALLHRTPIYFYNDKQSLMLLDTRKAVPYVISKLISVKEERNLEYEYKYRLRVNSLTPWIELWYTPVPPGTKDTYEIFKTLSEKAQRAGKNLRYADALNVFSADLHNEKSTPYDSIGKGREALDKLVGIMRNLKATPAEFIKRLSDKWYPPPPPSTYKPRAIF